MSKKLKWMEIISALVLLIGGLVLIFVPELTLVVIARALGVTLIIIGVLFLISYVARKKMASGNYDFVKGLVFIGLGTFVCIQSEMVMSILPVLLGIGVVISGIVKLQHALDLRRMAVEAWIRIGVVALFNVLIGLVLVMNPFASAAWLMRLIGAGLAFSGISDLIISIYTNKKAKAYYVDGTAEELDMDDSDKV